MFIIYVRAEKDNACADGVALLFLYAIVKLSDR